MPIFSDPSSEKCLVELDGFLKTRSYFEGFTPSKADLKILALIEGKDFAKFINLTRWYKHITSFAPDVRATWEGSDLNITILEPEKEDEEDFDLFDDDEDAEEAAKALAERKKKELAAKAKKESARSTLVIEVKPWDDETDMAELEKCVRSIELDGLLWGASKLEEVGYGIKKLQISAVIEDEKVYTDDIEEAIVGFDDYVQSMDIVAFQKL